MARGRKKGNHEGPRKVRPHTMEWSFGHHLDIIQKLLELLDD